MWTSSERSYGVGALMQHGPQLVAGDDPAGRSGQHLQNGELGRREVQGRAVPEPFTRVRIQRERAPLTGSEDVQQIQLSVRTGSSSEKAQQDIYRLMRDRRNLAPEADDDFNIMDQQEIASTISGTTRTLTVLLAAVAAISLLVGGIGIMNIMLVSVTERTREIGIRLAIGAFERDVLTQFLVEAVVLSLFGGAVGIGLALTGSAQAARALGLPFQVELDIVALAFLFSAAVGVVFGFFPARRAARLNPIDALRHE